MAELELKLEKVSCLPPFAECGGPVEGPGTPQEQQSLKRSLWMKRGGAWVPWRGAASFLHVWRPGSCFHRGGVAAAWQDLTLTVTVRGPGSVQPSTFFLASRSAFVPSTFQEQGPDPVRVSAGGMLRYHGGPPALG